MRAFKQRIYSKNDTKSKMDFKSFYELFKYHEDVFKANEKHGPTRKRKNTLSSDQKRAV
jgi:hypothetical protein